MIAIAKKNREMWKKEVIPHFEIPTQSISIPIFGAVNFLPKIDTPIFIVVF
ncbi:MAG: hypothetical protein NTZ69_17115 [Bacteroidia bacterium]|nr:hypothetical protein [Bacteroidia bacterium]